MADFRNPDAPATNDAAATRQGTLTVHAAAALYHLGDPDGVERMLQLYSEIRTLRRIFANAAKRRVAETDPTGIAIRNAIAGKQRDFAALEAFLLTSAGPVPDSQRTPFCTVPLKASGDEDIRWLATAMLTSPGAAWPLDAAQAGTIRRLSETLGK